MLADGDPLESWPGFLFHDEGGDALIGPRGQGDDPGSFAVRDPRLGAVEHILFAVALGAAGDVAGVAARIRLGEGQRAAPIPGSERGQPPLLLLLVSVVKEQRRDHGVRVDDARQAHPSVGQLFNDADVGQEVETEPAVGFGNRDAEEAELAHLLHDVGREAVFAFELGCDR